MKKRVFNNLFDSIIMVILAIIILGAFFLVVVFGGIKNENTNKVAVYICSSLVFIPMFITAICLIILHCFEWWIIDEGYICSKKPFRRKVIIRLDEIISVNEEEIWAFILELYKTNAIVIKSQTKKIIIYLNKKITSDYIMKELKK